MGSKAKKPDPAPAPAQLKDLAVEDGESAYEKDLKKLAKRSQTVEAGETGGYGGNTALK